MMPMSGMEHKGSEEVVGERLQMDLFFDHCRGSSAQNVESQRGFQVAEVELYLPAPTEQLGDRNIGIGVFVDQSSDDGNRIGTKTRGLAISA